MKVVLELQVEGNGYVSVDRNCPPYQQIGYRNALAEILLPHTGLHVRSLSSLNHFVDRPASHPSSFVDEVAQDVLGSPLTTFTPSKEQLPPANIGPKPLVCLSALAIQPERVTKPCTPRYVLTCWVPELAIRNFIIFIV
eukprot:COSAG02_NODE_5904_length_3946_cov_8.969327_2_plen_139_part_00